MLPPFRVRNDCSFLSNSHAPIVRIGALEYDTTVTRHPEATLKYFDEDDCDIITVGTSLELAQRLEEPLPTQTAAFQAHHIFNIDPSDNTVKIWQAYEQPEALDEPATTDLEQVRDRPCSDILPKSPSQENASEGARIHPGSLDPRTQHKEGADVGQTDGYRKQHFQACNPPQLNGRAPDQKHNESIQGSEQLARDPVGCPNGIVAHIPSSLTVEGKRQAQAAGDRLRTLASASRYSRSFQPCVDTAISQNRWASYSRSASPFLVEQARTSKLDSVSCHHDNKRQPQAAGDKLRDRDSRLRHCRSVPGPSEHGISKSRCGNFCLPPMVRFEDEITSLVNDSASLDIKAQRRSGSQDSLLHLFEAELAVAKEPREKAALSTKAQRGATTISPGFARRKYPASKYPVADSPEAQNTPRGQGENPSSQPKTSLSESDFSQSIHQAVDDISEVISELQRHAYATKEDQSRHQMGHALQLGLSAALQGFGACLNNISDTVKDALATGECNRSKLQNLSRLLQSFEGESSIPAGSRMKPHIDLEPRCQDQASAIAHQANTQSPWRMDPKAAIDTQSSRTSSFQLSQSETATPDFAKLTDLSATLPGPSNRERLGSTLNRDNAGRLPPPSESDTQNSEAGGSDDRSHSARVLDKTQNRTSMISKGPSGHSLDFGSNTEQPRFPPIPTAVIRSTNRRPTDVGKSTEPRQMSTSSAQHHLPTADPNMNVRSYRAMASSAHQASRMAVGIGASPRRPGQLEASRQPFDRMTSRANEANIPILRPKSPQRHLREIESGRVEPKARSTVMANGSTVQIQQMNGVLTDMDYAVDHSDAATASKIQECVEQLKALGFCSHANNGLGRLIVYAQAADGDLSDAIDMIDEEQQVYRQIP